MSYAEALDAYVKEHNLDEAGKAALVRTYAEAVPSYVRDFLDIKSDEEAAGYSLQVIMQTTV